MVGTAVYQVAWLSRSQPKNRSAWKPGVQKTRLPTDRGASNPAIRPWMWNIGITCRPQSDGVNCSVWLTLRADAHRLP